MEVDLWLLENVSLGFLMEVDLCCLTFLKEYYGNKPMII